MRAMAAEKAEDMADERRPRWTDGWATNGQRPQNPN